MRDTVDEFDQDETISPSILNLEVSTKKRLVGRYLYVNRQKNAICSSFRFGKNTGLMVRILEREQLRADEAIQHK